MRNSILQTPFCSIKNFNTLEYVIAKDLQTARNKTTLGSPKNCKFEGYAHYKNALKKEDELFSITLQHKTLSNESVTFFVIAYYFSEAEDLAIKLIRESGIYTAKEKSQFYVSNSVRLGNFIN